MIFWYLYLLVKLLCQVLVLYQLNTFLLIFIGIFVLLNSVTWVSFLISCDFKFCFLMFPYGNDIGLSLCHHFSDHLSANHFRLFSWFPILCSFVYRGKFSLFWMVLLSNLPEGLFVLFPLLVPGFWLPHQLVFFIILRRVLWFLCQIALTSFWCWSRQVYPYKPGFVIHQDYGFSIPYFLLPCDLGFYPLDLDLYFYNFISWAADLYSKQVSKWSVISTRFYDLTVSICPGTFWTIQAFSSYSTEALSSFFDHLSFVSVLLKQALVLHLQRAV
jgi:hypothetical protein